MESFKVRKPSVAGKFYPSSARELKNQIESFIDKKTLKEDVIGCILPHAGYMYSGMVAAETVSHVRVKDKVILLGPNHTGYGASFSIMTEGEWQTPLGNIKIDSDLAKKILTNSKNLEEDAFAHMYEHSIEVELPLLQYFNPVLEMVPIGFLSDDLETLKGIGTDIAKTLLASKMSHSVLLVASSDMTHYEPQIEAQKKDNLAIEAILQLNENALFERIKKSNITMCGYAPVIAMLSCAKALGAKKAKLIKYQTSGDITKDKSSVVGYAGITIN